MATATSSATRKKPASRSKKAAGSGVDSAELKRRLESSLERVERSIDAAEMAAKDLRSGTAKGSRDLVQDLERTLRNARANARRIGKSLSKDLDRAVRGSTPRRRASSSKQRA